MFVERGLNSFTTSWTLTTPSLLGHHRQWRADLQYAALKQIMDHRGSLILYSGEVLLINTSLFKED